MSSLIYVQLTITAGSEVGRRYALRLGQTFVIGRSKKVAVRLVEDTLISREHATIELRREGIFVTDLGSRNGTFLGGKQVPPNQPVDASEEDTLELGRHTLEFRLLGIQGADDSGSIPGLPRLPAGEFEILGLIGEGSTGRVFAAEQKLLRRRVAIKVLNAHMSRDEEERERFLREGWICSQIQSPHVVDVFDVRMIRGQVCLIMELVQGPSALDRLKDGPLPLIEVLRIGEDVARALQASQEVGVVHRDIKPSNILLDPRGVAKLTDFGIAKSLSVPVSNPELTPLGEGMGTMAYVSPEQARSARQADLRSDIYGLGATLYHLLSGQPPFQPRCARDLFETITQSPKPLSSYTLQPPPPQPLCEFIHAMMAKDPADRPHPPGFVSRILHGLRVELFPDEPAKGHGAHETGEHTAIREELRKRQKGRK